MELKDQLKQVQTDLEAERAKGAERNNDVVDRLAIQEADILKQMMVERQNRLATIPTLPLADLKAWETELLNQDEIDTDALKAVQERIAELEQEQEKVQRDQRQQEVIDQATDLLPAIFDALLPADTFEDIFGLTGYGEKRKEFYQLTGAYTADHVQKATEPYEQDLAQKDEKIRLMNKQSLEVQQQMDSIVDQLKAEKDAHDKTQSEFASVRAQLNTALSDGAARDEKIAELQSKVNQPTTLPSANVQDLITQIKSKNTVNVDDMVARFNARQKSEDAKLPLPEVASAPATFLNTQSHSDTVHNGDTATPAEDLNPSNLEVKTFPVVPGTEMANEQPGVQTEGATVEERVAALEAESKLNKARFDRLEKQANLPALEVA